MKLLTIIIAILVLSAAGLQAWRWFDHYHAAAVWQMLQRSAPSSPAVFEPSMVEHLPNPARRFFLFVIQPGAPLHTVTEIRMSGEIGLGSQEAPNYLPMRAHQILAPPHGLIWQLEAGQGALRIAGSDGFNGERSWVRFWLLGILPVVRAGGGPDHARAAFGRVVAESVFWAPAALLPQTGVSWEAVSRDVARATVVYKGLSQAVDITVAADGQPVKVVILRWSDANPAKTYQLQPFGGYLSAFREFDGYRLPTHVEGGNFIDTDDYFPFYKATVEELKFVVDG